MSVKHYVATVQFRAYLPSEAAPTEEALRERLRRCLETHPTLGFKTDSVELQEVANQDDEYSELRRNQEAFEAMRAELCQEHEGEYVIVHGGKVVGFFDDEAEAFAECSRRYGREQAAAVEFVSLQPRSFTVGPLRFT